MPQWRKFHVKTTDSLDINDMPDDFTRLMWCLLPLKSCRKGRGIDMPQWIKAQLFPLRSDVSLEQVESAMTWYDQRGMIERYEVDNRPYYEICNWKKYQGSTEREADSPYPCPKNADVNKDEKEKEEKEVDSDASEKTNSRPTHEQVESNELPSLPVHLATADMLNEWGEWLEYHKERGKPITKSTALLQFEQFNEWGEERSIAVLKHSRLNNYTGLIEPRGNNQHKETPAERIARLEKEIENEGLD